MIVLILRMQFLLIKNILIDVYATNSQIAY